MEASENLTPTIQFFSISVFLWQPSFLVSSHPQSGIENCKNVVGGLFLRWEFNCKKWRAGDLSREILFSTISFFFIWNIYAQEFIFLVAHFLKKHPVAQVTIQKSTFLTKREEGREGNPLSRFLRVEMENQID